MTEKTVTRPSNIVRADEVIGYKVINQQKENLGKVYQLALDKFTGKVIYVVLETGSFLGIGGKLLALPWNALKYDPNEEAFVVNISKDRIKEAPGFDKNHWPDFSDQKWSTTIIEFYGKGPDL